MRNALQGMVVLVLALLVVAGGAGPAGASGADNQPITTRVALSTHRVVAGHPIKGAVVLTNTTERSITVDTCAMDGWLRVGLHGKVDSYPFLSFSVACKPTVRLAPGENRFPVTVITTYASCQQPQSSPPSPSTSPPCTESNGHLSQPPLPAGRYSTKLDVVGLTGLTRRPNRVVVTLKAPAHAPVLPPCTGTPSSAPTLVTVPNVVGDSSSGAALVFAKACLNAGYANPVGTRVIAESPPAQTKVPEYSTVTLTTR